MPRQSLEEQLEDARSTDNPFESLYDIAKSLRDIGLSQLDLYCIFIELFHKHQADEDETFYDTITDILDCIWCGGWGKDRELFDEPLSDEQTGIVSIEIDEPTADSDKWEMSINHPHIYLRCEIYGPQIVHDFLAFMRSNLNKSEYTELKLGTLGSAVVSIIKDDEFPNRFFLCILSDSGTVRYTLNVNELGDYIGGLMQATDDLPYTPTK
ncbi:MAG: hypothetical protein P1V19_14450 [Gimesia sp.]|nr:hypothetical protein [Gimesia sp.]